MNIPRHFTQGVEDKPDFELIYRQYYKRIITMFTGSSFTGKQRKM